MGLPGSPVVLRTRVAAPSVCFAVACILLAAAPTAPPCFRRWRQSSPLPPLGELSAKQTERFLRNSTKKKTPFRSCSSGRGFSFALVRAMNYIASIFCTFIICHSPQKSSAVQKVYRRPLRRFAPALPEGEPLAGRVAFYWTPEFRYGARGRALLQRAAASGQALLVKLQ